MKTILLGIVLTSAISCNQIDQYSTSNISTQHDDIKIDTATNVSSTTALVVEPLKKTPSSFVLDSIFNKDSIFNYSTEIYFPKSTDEELNKSIKQFIDYRIGLEKPENKTNENTLFQMWVIRLNVSSHLIHCLFRQQSFTEGSAHYNHSYLTLNYDPKKKKKIVFTDVFKFLKNKNKQSFCNKINGYVNGVDDSDGYNEGLNPEQIDSDLNYTVLNQKLIVYPNYCCSEENKIFEIDLNLIKDYINPTLRKNFD